MPAAPDSSLPSELRLPVAAVARRLGIAPATLRTWDRRYGIGPSEHTAGEHRRYSATDLRRLEAMRRLIADGVPPADAARAVQAGAEPASPSRPAPLSTSSTGALLAELGAAAADAAAGGGRVLATPSSGPAVRGLARAAMALDAEAVVDVIRTAVEASGVVAAWEHLVVPVLTAVGERWEATGEGVEVEHLLSECTLTVLRPRILDAETTDSVARPLLACAPDENHSLPVHVLAAALAEQGVASRVLGAATPPDALAAATRRVGPSTVFVWSQLPATADVAALALLPRLRPAAVVVAGGPGWVPSRLPPRVTYADSLDAAVALVSLAAGDGGDRPGGGTR